MKRNRRTRSPAFKPKMAMEALKGEKTVAQLASRFNVPLNLAMAWRKVLVKGADSQSDARIIDAVRPVVHGQADAPCQSTYVQLCARLGVSAPLDDG